jgi:DNA-binding NarL/FixJ family response regulator
MTGDARALQPVREPGSARRSTSRGSTIRTFLVDDHHLVREGLRLVLDHRANIEVVGEAATAGEVLVALYEALPDVVLLDITIGEEDGIPLIRTIRAELPTVRILVLTMHRGAETVRQALLAGADGYIVKGAHASELVAAILVVARGDRYLHPSITAAVVDDSLRWMQSAQRLSVREQEILTLVATGQPANVIAERLGISPHTVRRHIANLAAKLELRGIAALTRYAVENGLVRRP